MEVRGKRQTQAGLIGIEEDGSAHPFFSSFEDAMRSNYAAWLEDRKYAAGTQTAQLHRVKRVEEAYGDLDDHFRNGTLKDVVASLEYSTSDERSNKPNPSKLKIDGNIRNNLQSYKNAVVRYTKFLSEAPDETASHETLMPMKFRKLWMT